MRNKVGKGFLDVVINKVALMKETVAEITSLTKDVYANNQMAAQSQSYLTNEEVDQKCQELMELKDSIGKEIVVRDKSLEEQAKNTDVIEAFMDSFLSNNFFLRSTMPGKTPMYGLDPFSVVSRSGLEYDAGNQGNQDAKING